MDKKELINIINNSDNYPLLKNYTNFIVKMGRPVLGRDAEMKQVLASLLRPEVSNVVLLAHPGTGKGHRPNTLIPVADSRGYIHIKDLKVGDYVYSEFGLPIRVEGIFPQGFLPLFEVETEFNNKEIVNGEHLWSVYEQFNTPTVMSTEEMFYAGLLNDFSEYKFSIDKASAVVRDEYELPIDPYIVGVLLNNCNIFDGELRLYSDDKYILKLLKDKNDFITDFNQCLTFPNDYIIKNGDNTLLLDLLKNKMGEKIFGLIFNEGRIPKEYYLGSIEQRKSLLKGLMDSAGHVDFDKSCVYFYSTFFDLAKDVSYLMASLGINNRIEHLKYGYSVRCFCNHSDLYELFALPNKILNIDLLVDSYEDIYEDRVYIKNIKELKQEDEIICIQVDNPTHLYQVGRNHIVTHNTALVSGLSELNPSRLYLEVDIAKMVTGVKDASEMGSLLKQLADEVAEISERSKMEIVLFMDEVHQIVHLSELALEALKPILANSGLRGIKIICATTYEEFDKYIAGNQALVERLQRINLLDPSEDVVVSILKSFASKYIPSVPISESLYHKIYEYTNRYIPAEAQPRKSILVLDAMIGDYRLTNEPINEKMLARVMLMSKGVNVNLDVDGTTIKERLDNVVFAQELATTAIQKTLQTSVAGFADPEKPLATLLFTGSTGTGKMLSNDTPVPTPNGWVNHGDLKENDLVFNRLGKAKPILVTFKHKNIPMYKVTLTDGRYLIAGDSHLWTVKTLKQKQSKSKNMLTLSTKEMLDKGLYIDKSNNRRALRFWVPKNGAVEYNERNVDIDPYLKGYYLKDKFIPDEYKYNSVDNRFKLLQGLFDCDGSVSNNYRCHVRYSTTSKILAEDVREVLLSLGYGVSIMVNDRSNKKHIEYNVLVSGSLESKLKLFSLPGKLDIINNAIINNPRIRHKNYDYIGIKSIEYVGNQDAQCIYIDDDEHLYQAGDFVVTHNTAVSKELAKILFNDVRSFIRMDMSEYSNPSSVERFREELTRKIWERPFSVLLLDEIEKACGEVTLMLLQVLDDARLVNKHNKVVSFKNCYIIMTTNAGSEVYKTVGSYMASDTGINEELDRLMPIIKDSLRVTSGGSKFPPELLGRITSIIPFQPLSEATMKKIVLGELKKQRNFVQKLHDVTVGFDVNIVDYILGDKLTGDTDEGGARSIISIIRNDIMSEIAAFINSNKLVKNIFVRVDGSLMSQNKNQLKSRAKIIVEEYVG